MNIEINKPNRLKDLTHRIFNRSEDLMFSIFQKLPEKFIPGSVMNWMEKYTNKRISELQQQIVHDRWNTIELEKVAEQIRNQ